MNNEDVNFNLTVENAKDIQSLKDAFALQAAVNRNTGRSQVLLGLGGMILCGVVYIILGAVSELEKRVKTIEGTEKKTEDAED